jgi:hypothetical protein
VAPTLNCPGVLFAVCSLPDPYEDFSAFINAGGSASDECGINETSFAWAGDVSDGNNNPETITRTYRIFDYCGHEATCEQTILRNKLKIETWVYLEGSAIELKGKKKYKLPMRTTLNDLYLLPGQCYRHCMTGVIYSPPGQPYNCPPWDYPGNEGDAYDSYGNPLFGTASYPDTVVDWVLVSLRGEPDGQSLCQAAALLNKEGSVEFTGDGFQCCDLDGYDAFFIVIEHRNHLIVMSDTAISIENFTLTYDFRFTQSYHGYTYAEQGRGQKEIKKGIYAMYAGNGDQTKEVYSDTDINFDDNVFWGWYNCSTGHYRKGDYNMNGDCNYDDRTIWEYNNGIYSFVPR